MEGRTVEGVVQTFVGKGACWGPDQPLNRRVNEDRRATVSNPMLDKIDQPGVGRILAPGSPLSFSEIDRGQPTVAPRLGEHTDEILLEMLSMTSTEVGKLHDNGVVAGPQS